jgi:hypothetical protein
MRLGGVRLVIWALLLIPLEARPDVANCSGTRDEVMGSECWTAGNSCDGHGVITEFPVTIEGTVVKSGATHGGCNFSNWFLVYEPKSSPLKLRVCMKETPPMNCPATIRDYARWDIAALLKANGATRAKVMKR